MHFAPDERIIPTKIMAKYVLLVVALACIALNGCQAKPKAPKASTQSDLEQLAAQAQAAVKDLGEKLGLNDLPDSKKIVETLNTQTQTLATNVQQIVDKIKGELKAHEGDASSVLKDIEKKLSETKTTLEQTAGPKATAQAKQLGDSLKQGLKNTVDQVEQLLKAVEPDATKAKTEIQNAAQTLLNQVAEISNNVKEQVKANVADHEKTHKH